MTAFSSESLCHKVTGLAFHTYTPCRSHAHNEKANQLLSCPSKNLLMTMPTVRQGLHEQSVA